jgi:hypothetical protein
MLSARKLYQMRLEIILTRRLNKGLSAATVRIWKIHGMYLKTSYLL